jgi:hypothetical protein
MTHYTWANWNTMPKGMDLYLFIDYRQHLFQVCHHGYSPRAIFWWDAFHHMQSVSAQIALSFDKVYVAELIDANYMKSVGFSNVEWLPGAFYPGLYHPTGSNKVHDYSFIGQFDDTVVRKGLTRRSSLDLLAKNFRGFVSNSIRGPYVNQIYNEGRILPERTIFANIGTRLFEVVGSGGFCLINRFPCNTGLDLLGIDGEHFVSYNESEADLLYKFRYYLNNEGERQKIAKSGHDLFISQHTYKNRLKRIFTDFNI